VFDDVAALLTDRALGQIYGRPFAVPHQARSA
jgi:hypothetical protein